MFKDALSESPGQKLWGGVFLKEYSVSLMAGHNRDNYLISSRLVFLLWLVAFSYALTVALVLQKLVLPMIPSMHAGHGLMPDDAIYFHGVAVEMAERIRQHGWSEWHLIPSSSATGHVGLLAAVYAVFGPEPAWFLPINAGFHALGSVLVVLIALQILPTRSGFRAGLVAGFCFLIFPSALVWFGQNHKDAFVIAGFLLCLLAFIRTLVASGGRRLLVNICMFSTGLALVAIMRAHMVLILSVAFIGAFLLMCAIWLLRRERSELRGLGGLLALVIVGLLAIPMLPTKNEFAEGGGIFTTGWQWHDSSYLPGAVDELLERITSVRVHFVNYGLSVEAGSIIDADVKPRDATEVVTYLPRALQIGLLAPFPDFWMERLSLARVIGALETLVFYLFIPGAIYLLMRRMTRPLVVSLAVAGALLLVHAYVSPNLGTLHRVRYGQWLVFLVVGACGWALLFERLMARLAVGRPAVEIDASQSLPSGAHAAGAGLMVMLVSMLGFLGLLIRDLMLIDNVGFGAELDSYYLAMMPPMFFIALLAAPMGDALSSRITQLAERVRIQGLLGAVTSFTLLLFVVISALLLLFSSSIFEIFTADGQVASAQRLFPMALLLLVFSGAIMAGNSLLNAYGKPVQAASAQLIVPLVVICSILLAGDSDVVLMAMAGMALGQLANLLLLYIVLYRHGFSMVPRAMRPLRHEGDMLHNFKWLSLCALLTGLTVPVNYWFAGNIGVGAVSTWALGSKLVQVSSLLGTALMAAVFVPYMSRVVAQAGETRIRGDVFTSLTMGAWGCTVLVVAVFIFAEPIVFAAASSLNDESAATQLVNIIKLGALQLPFVFSSILLFKLCAVSSMSLKAVMSALVGMFVNIVLNFLFVPVLGLLGLALAWTLASLAVSLVAIAMTRRQSHLSRGDILMVAAIWGVQAGLAGAIHFLSPLTGLLALVVGAGVLWLQLRALSRQRLTPVAR